MKISNGKLTNWLKKRAKAIDEDLDEILEKISKRDQ